MGTVTEAPTRAKRSSTHPRRSREDWKTLAQEILPALQSGTTISELRERYSIGQTYTLKVELAKLGFSLQGRPLSIEPVEGKKPETLAKRIAKRREKGEPMWSLEVASGLGYADLQALLREHGFANLAEGRTTNGG
jgi:hypothetical protein